MIAMIQYTSWKRRNTYNHTLHHKQHESQPQREMQHSKAEEEEEEGGTFVARGSAQQPETLEQLENLAGQVPRQSVVCGPPAKMARKNAAFGAGRAPPGAGLSSHSPV